MVGPAIRSVRILYGKSCTVRDGNTSVTTSVLTGQGLPPETFAAGVQRRERWLRLSAWH